MYSTGPKYGYVSGVSASVPGMMCGRSLQRSVWIGLGVGGGAGPVAGRKVVLLCVWPKWYFPNESSL
jgi:hypothetical protein